MNRLLIHTLAALFFAPLHGCAQKPAEKKPTTKTYSNTMTDTITIGGGCFWCTEAIYQRLNGVLSVTSGYAGGKVKNPTYKEICTGLTGHAECVQIEFDTSKISLIEILQVFFKTHDPTTLNRQGNDVGTQYRSVVFYDNEEKKKIAEEVISGLQKSGAFNDPVVTTIEPITVFYKAEDYHQNYYNDNKNSNPYCTYVIVPKVEKFEKYFAEKLKKR